jgi:hypothetical protein
MARRKPLDQLSPAYRRRIESAERRGLSRSEARGHGPQGSEYSRRTSEKAVRMRSQDPYAPPGDDPYREIDRLLRVYTVAGLVPVLRAKRRLDDAYSVYRRTRQQDDYEAMIRQRDALHAAHNRYKRRRKLPDAPYLPRDVEDIGENLYDVDLDLAYEGGDDYDTILLFYH